MKYLLSILMLIPVMGLSQTGEKIQGPNTLGQPSYPSSGPLRSRSNDMTGSDMSNSTFMGSDVNPAVPEKNPRAEAGRPETQTGPYRDSRIYHPEEGPDGIEAQEAARNDEFDLSKEEIERKQRGE